MTLKWTWKKGLILSLLLLLGAEELWFAVSPTHWLIRKVDFGTVKIDGQPVKADFFLGEPDGEAEAIVLVHLKNGSDYFLNFGNEEVRDGNPSEYAQLFGGVWCFRSIKKGLYREPLPFLTLNQFRIRTQDNHLVSIQF